MKRKHSSLRWFIAFLAVIALLAFAACTYPFDAIDYTDEQITSIHTEASSEHTSTTTVQTEATTTAESKTPITTLSTSTTQNAATSNLSSSTRTQTTTSKNKTTTSAAPAATTTRKPDSTTLKTTTTVTSASTSKPATTTITSTTVTTTATTAAAYSPIAWEPGQMKSDFVSIGKNLGYTYDSSLNTGNSHWVTPMYTGAYSSRNHVTRDVSEHLVMYQSVGYSSCNFYIEADTKYPDRPGEYRIYILVA